MKPLKIKLSITLDEDIAERMKELAEEDDRSLLQYINLVCREHLSKLEMNKAPRGEKAVLP